MVTFRFSTRSFIGALVLLPCVAGASILGLTSAVSGAIREGRWGWALSASSEASGSKSGFPGLIFGVIAPLIWMPFRPPAHQRRMPGVTRWNMRLCLMVGACILSVACANAGLPSPPSDSPAPTQLVILDPTLRTSASGAVSKFFQQCAQQPGRASVGCPQLTTEGCVPFTGTCLDGDFRWTLVGDPAAQLDFHYDSQGRLLAVGHYLMTVSGNIVGSPMTDISGGPFMADLEPTEGGLAVTRLQSGRKEGDGPITFQVNARDLPDPGADRQVLLAATRSHFDYCSTMSEHTIWRCGPLYVSCSQGLGLAWTPIVDPLAGATVTFDTQLGTYSVEGKYHFKVAGSDAGACEFDHDISGHYQAIVVWNEGQAQVVRFNGGW